MSADTGGPAFPYENRYEHEGMTLRDYFAAKAMQGIMTDPDMTMGADKLAEWAYTMADAMLKARDA